MIKLIDDSLAEFKPKASAPKTATKTASPPPPPEEKWSRENHPAFKKTAAPAPPPPVEEKEAEPLVITYQVNDNVMAKWVTGDKGFYPARITAVTGSSTAPVYTVKFKSYDTTETLRAKDIRSIAQKRKADGSTTASSSAAAPGAASSFHGKAAPVVSPAPNNGIVMSAGAEMYANAQQGAKADGNADENPKKKVKKIKATKELEAGKSKWQEFSTKGKHGKGAKKDSMFRTPDGVHGRGKSGGKKKNTSDLRPRG